MSKKNTGLLIAFGAAIGAAAAGISYYLKYKSFHDDLNRDFHDYEDEYEDAEAENTEEKEPETVSCEKSAGRKYISLGAFKKKTKAAAVPETPASSADALTTASVKEEDTAEKVTVEEDTDGADA